jgi:YlmC/YmxH family sporulation protein
MDYDITFNELRCKDVVNTVDGKRLGKATDIVIDLKCAVVLGLVLPGEKKFFKSSDDLFIPWHRITKIGDDVILVKINETDTECPAIPAPK